MTLSPKEASKDPTHLRDLDCTSQGLSMMRILNKWIKELRITHHKCTKTRTRIHSQASLWENQKEICFKTWIDNSNSFWMSSNTSNSHWTMNKHVRWMDIPKQLSSKRSWVNNGTWGHYLLSKKLSKIWMSNLATPKLSNKLNKQSCRWCLALRRVRNRNPMVIWSKTEVPQQWTRTRIKMSRLSNPWTETVASGG